LEGWVQLAELRHGFATLMNRFRLPPWVACVVIAALGAGGRPSAAQDEATSAAAAAAVYELRCRGGPWLVIDTLTAVRQEARALEISLTFPMARSAAGRDGSALEPSSCAWIDRPLHATEPPQVRFVDPPGSSAGAALRDPDQYWMFMVHNTGRGHLEAAWHGPAVAAGLAGAPPLEEAGSAPASVRWWLPSPLLPRHLLRAFGLYLLVAWVPLNWLLGVRSAWKVLSDRYPAVPLREGPRFWCGWLIVGRSRYRNLVRLTAGESHLHASVILPFRPGRPPLSVPWGDILVSRDVFPFPRFAVHRFTFARAPEVRFLVPTGVGEKVIAASRGRLRLPESVGSASLQEVTAPRNR
jgi:hypothetical protein